MKQGQFPAVLPLASLDGQIGFKIDGENTQDLSGWSVSGTGDINRDGHDDLIVGAYGYPGLATGGRGRSYVVFGGPGVGNSGVLSLSSLNGTNGFKLDGEDNGDESGRSVSAAGDVNGDGYPDFIIGANYYDSSKGRSYVIFGSALLGSEGALSLSNLNGDNGFKIDGENNGDHSGYPVNMVGDVNGDRYADLIMGAPYYLSGNAQGRSYVVYGGLDVGEGGYIKLSSLNGVNGFKLDGENNYDWSGQTVSSAGDINGDGYVDLIIGASGYGQWKGRSYVVWGGPRLDSGSGILSLSNLNGTNGFKLDGENMGDDSGWFVNVAGDVNSDGYADLIIGANYYNSSKGRSYVVFGGPGIGDTGVFNLSALTGTNGFKLDGEVSGDQSGYAGSGIGDINGDGYADLLIGAFGHANSTGRSYVMFGGSDVGGNGTISLSSLNEVNGFKLDGEISTDASGWSVGAAGDINSDGVPDILIGAYGHSNNTGRSYVVFGDIPPVLVNNSLSLYSQQTILLDADDLGAYDRNHDNNTLLFIPTEIAHGQFEAVNTPGVFLSNFTQQQILNGAIQFVQDGSLQAPSYNITVRSTGIAWTGPAAAEITFNVLQLITNQLVINQGQTVILTSEDLNATDTGGEEADIILMISHLQQGQFEFINMPGQSILSFSQQNVNDGVVCFVHDGTIAAPAYQVTVSNGQVTLPAQDAAIDFDTMPVLENNQLVINQGQTVLLTSEILSATHPMETDDGLLKFDLSDIQQGQFSWISSPMSALTSFYQQNITDQVLQFSHDNSTLPPSYAVSVEDGRMQTDPVFSTVIFYKKPLITTNQLLIHQNETVIMTPESLSVADDYPSDEVNFLISNVQYGQFQLLPLNTSLTQFTEGQLAAGEVAFQQDGTTNAPSYQVGVSDPYFTLPATSPVVTTFYRQPVFVNNQLTILEGETVLFTSSLLNAADDYPDAQVLFIIGNVHQGQFQLISAGNATTIQFTQQQIKSSQIQFVHDNTPQSPNYTVTMTDGFFTIGPSNPQINFTLVDKPPLLLHPIPPETFAVGEPFNFKIASDTFYDEQNQPISLSSALAEGSPLPPEIIFDPPSATFTGLVTEIESFNISVNGTSVADLTTTTYFMLQIAGKSSSSSLIDLKTLLSVLGSLVTIGLTVASYFYARYHSHNRRENQDPFANKIHKHLNLSYGDFDHDRGGEKFKQNIDKMKELLIEKKSDIKLQDTREQAHYADLFAQAIVDEKDLRYKVHCGCSQELKFDLLVSRRAEIVRKVIEMEQNPIVEPRNRSGGWCSFFRCCRPSSSPAVSLSSVSSLNSSSDNSSTSPLLKTG